MVNDKSALFSLQFSAQGIGSHETLGQTTPANLNLIEFLARPLVDILL